MDKKIKYIEALGNLLATYRSDLFYIKRFNDFKNGRVSKTDYLTKEDGSFRRFINYFRVARNISKDNVDEFLDELQNWISGNQSNDVDQLATKVKGLGYTHGKVMTSLCSKVLFLNNPYEIIPIDQLAKRAIGYRGNKYSEFRSKLDSFRINHTKEINSYIASVSNHIDQIEKDFKWDIPNIEVIRQNRYLDKIMWTSGR